MELEMGSDDDLFSEGKDRSLKEHLVWSPKQCEPECLFEDDSVMSVGTIRDQSSTEHAQILAYRADFLYGKKQFSSALPIYVKGVAVVPLRYVLLRRIFIEGTARCYMRMDDHAQALHMATLLLEESLTLEHRMTAHSLLASVHTASGNIKDAIRSLHVCIRWQRSNPHFWLKLAEAYSALYRQSQHASQRSQTECTRSGPTCANCSDVSTSQTRLLGVAHGKAAFESPLCHSSLVNYSHVYVNTVPKGTVSSGIGPQTVAEDDPQHTYGNLQQGHLTGDSDSNCDQRTDKRCLGEHNLHAQELQSAATDSVMEKPNGSETEKAETDAATVTSKDSSISNLLNELDNLVITDRGENAALWSSIAEAERQCSEHRPVLLAASCLLRTRLLLKSVEHSVGSFAKVSNSQQRVQIEESLAAFHLDPAVVKVLHHHARIIFRRGCNRVDEVASATDEADAAAAEESDVSTEEFEQSWFPWVLDINPC